MKLLEAFLLFSRDNQVEGKVIQRLDFNYSGRRKFGGRPSVKDLSGDEEPESLFTAAESRGSP